MGDVADMMINGFLCEACGGYIDGEEPGYPRYCSKACARDRGAPWAPERHQQRGPRKHRRRRHAHG
jgi:hypothetical protein